MGSCAVEGGCPSDYIAVTISAVSVILLLIRSAFPFLFHKVPPTKGGDIWLVWIQIFASVNLILAMVMAINFLKFERRHWWQSCYMWAGWFEGPLGFGLLMSCRIVQAFKLYYLFVRRHLPPIRSYIFLPLVLLPWIGMVTFLHLKKPLNSRCHLQTRLVTAIVILHALYIAAMIGITRAIQHVEFRFHEFKDLLKGIIVSTVVLGVWISSYVLNQVHDDIKWLQVISRFMLLLSASILILSFYSISISQPLLSQMSLRKRDPQRFETMGQALGIPDSGLLSQRRPLDVSPGEPLDKLLQNKIFRQSFMAFADSCLAGESVHFYDEVNELNKIPVDDHVRRVYMARYIIDKYIVEGAAMEVNISHRRRQEILATPDLTHPDLFKNTVHELIQLMKTNLGRDYWSSMFFVKFKEELSKQSGYQDSMERLVGLDYSPRLSAVRCADDPFHQEHLMKSASRRSDIHETDAQ